MIRVSCFVIENDVQTRDSIVEALTATLEPELTLGVDGVFDDIEQAITSVRRTRRSGKQLSPDLVVADLYRREGSKPDPERIAISIRDERIRKLELLRLELGDGVLLVVMSQYVGFFLEQLPGDRAEEIIMDIKEALECSDANISYVIDKFNPLDIEQGYAEVKRRLLALLSPGRQ